MTDDKDALEELKRSRKTIKNTLHPDVLPFLWGWGSIGDSLRPVDAVLDAAITAWEKERADHRRSEAMLIQALRESTDALDAALRGGE